MRCLPHPCGGRCWGREWRHLAVQVRRNWYAATSGVVKQARGKRATSRRCLGGQHRAQGDRDVFKPRRTLPWCG
jgi:hypothetical protein